MATTPESIALNLDTAERERTFEPYFFVLNGRKIQLKDPKELDWKEVLDIDEPIFFLRYVFINAEDKEYFKEQQMPTWKLEKLIDGYQRHFGLDTRGGGVASRL